MASKCAQRPTQPCRLADVTVKLITPASQLEGRLDARSDITSRLF
jgi:hypothetical protein